MKLQNVLSKLKQSKLKIVDFQNCDPDRVGDLLLALALAATVISAAMTPFYAAHNGGLAQHFWH